MPTPKTHPLVDEFAHVDLDDERRDNALIETALAIAEAPGKALPEALGSSPAYRAGVRVLTNAAVDPQAIIDAHVVPTLARCQAVTKVLAVNDTTQLNCKSSTEGKRKQIHVHTLMAFDAEAVPLGVLNQQAWVRDDQPKKAATRKQRCVSEKESSKWLRALEALNLAAQSCPKTRFTLVGDAESDMYELFEQAREPNVEVLSRACRDRALGDKGSKLFAFMRGLPVTGSYELKVAARPAGAKKKAVPARTAHMEVRMAQLVLDAPGWLRRQRRETPTSLPMSAVLVREAKPAPGQKAIEWLLLTSRTVRTLEDALEVVHDYQKRWEIELYHKVLKSGLNIESSQLTEHEDLKRLLAVCSVVGWRVMHVLHVGRSRPDTPGEELLLAEEWQVLWLRMKPNEPLPAHAPTAGELLMWIARLGGHLGRKHDKRPGVIVVWRGMASLSQMAAGFRLARDANAKSKRSGAT